MKTDRLQPSFGSIQYKDAQKVQYFMFRHLSPKQQENYRFLHSKNEFCSVDMFLSVVKNKNGKERLQAEVGDKTFISTLFKSPTKIIKKATEYAFKLEEAAKDLSL